MACKPSANFWQPLSGSDSIPEKAVYGGYDSDNSKIYVGRATCGEIYYLCPIIERKKLNFATITHNGRQIPKHYFEILVENENLYEWLPALNKDIPENAVSVNNEKVFIGRGHYDNNLLIGVIQPSLGYCFVSVDGTEHKIDKYDILVVKNNNKKNIGELENVVKDIKDVKIDNEHESEENKLEDSLIADTQVSINGVPENIIYKYEIGKMLGKGGFGEVYLVTNKSSGHKFAMKLIKSKNSKEISKEAQVMHKLNYIHLTHLYDFGKSVHHNAIIMEHMVGGNLQDLMDTFKTKKIDKGRLPVELARLYFYQMCKGVNYLHKYEYTHRDLKPGNLLLATKATKTLLKVSDFGLTKAEDLKTVCGTLGYRAPEILQEKRRYEKEPYTQKVDVWSMGIILYEILYGSRPNKELEKLLSTEFWKKTELEKPKALMKKMIIKEPNRRVSTQWIIDEEGWFNSSDLRTDIQEIKTFFE